jgi:hypothetical protein
MRLPETYTDVEVEACKTSLEGFTMVSQLKSLILDDFARQI